MGPQGSAAGRHQGSQQGSEWLFFGMGNSITHPDNCWIPLQASLSAQSCVPCHWSYTGSREVISQHTTSTLPCCWPGPHCTYLLVHFNVQTVGHLVVLRGKPQHSLLRSCPEQLAQDQPGVWLAPAHEEWLGHCARSLGQGREQPQAVNTCDFCTGLSQGEPVPLPTPDPVLAHPTPTWNQFSHPGTAAHPPSLGRAKMTTGYTFQQPAGTLPGVLTPIPHTWGEKGMRGPDSLQQSLFQR